MPVLRIGRDNDDITSMNDLNRAAFDLDASRASGDDEYLTKGMGKFGRRRLMLFGCLGVGLSHVAASFAYHKGLHGIWVLVLTLCAIACYAMSLAPVTWVLITEIFPNRVRASSVSISVAALWFASFALTYTFPLLNKGIGTAGTFLTYGGICFLGALFIFSFVPETKGRSLEQIEDAGM